MASVPIDYVPNLNERLDFLRKASDTDISALVDSIPELWTCLPQDYLRELEALDHMICLRSSLVCWAVSKGRIVPREMQLRSILADQRGRDNLISAGTGSGKTFPIALCTLLDDPAKKKVTIVVSPLKQLQKSQANACIRKESGVSGGSLSHVVPNIEIESNQTPPSVYFEQFGAQEQDFSCI